MMIQQKKLIKQSAIGNHISFAEAAAVVEAGKDTE